MEKFDSEEDKKFFSKDLGKTRKVPESKYIISENIKKLGEQLVLVREINVPNKLKEMLRSEDGLSREGQLEFFDYFFEITGGRYPSYATLNHVIGGGDRPREGQEFLDRKIKTNDTGKIEIKTNLGLTDREIEILFETKTDIKQGFCCGLGYNEYFAKKFFVGGGPTGEGEYLSQYVNNKNKPLLIFGPLNKKFLEFINKKYTPIYKALKVKDMESFIDSNYIKQRQEIAEEIVGAPYYWENKHGKHDELAIKMGEIYGLNKNSLMYNFDAFAGGKDFSPEADFFIANNMLVAGDSGDGTFISSSIEEYHKAISKRFNLKIETEENETLTFNHAEMIIDLHGLFDGKPKIIDFSSVLNIKTD